MYEFIKKNIYLIILFIITLSIGFLTFLTFIDKGFIELSDQNLQILLVLNIVLLIALFVFIFIEIRSAIKNDIDKDGLKSNKKYITYFGLFTLIPSVLISIFSLFLFSFALEKYFDKKVTTVVNNSYELARNYVEEIRNKIQSDIVLIAFDTNKSKKFLNDNHSEYTRLGIVVTTLKNLIKPYDYFEVFTYGYFVFLPGASMNNSNIKNCKVVAYTLQNICPMF